MEVLVVANLRPVILEPVLAAASPYFATKPPVPIYIYALLLKLKRRRASARWTISNFLPKSPIQSFFPSVFRQYGSRTIDDCVAFYHRTFRRAKAECLQAMESLVYENSPLADYLQGEWDFSVEMCGWVGE